jgi:hypothetical protein
MKKIFIKRNTLTSHEKNLSKTTIIIEKPMLDNDGMFYCNILFSNIEKYNAVAKGIDEFNAVECALDYVTTICKNSDDPEFYWDGGESMRSARGL